MAHAPSDAHQRIIAYIIDNIAIVIIFIICMQIASSRWLRIERADYRYIVLVLMSERAMFAVEFAFYKFDRSTHSPARKHRSDNGRRVGSSTIRGYMRATQKKVDFHSSCSCVSCLFSSILHHLLSLSQPLHKPICDMYLLIRAHSYSHAHFTSTNNVNRIHFTFLV